MPIRPKNPFWDLEDTEYWDRYSVEMRLRSHLKKHKNDWIVQKIRQVRHMNPFHFHGIKHLSPSSVNMFTGSATAWVARYLLGYKFSVGPAAWRGIAVEDGLTAYLFKQASVEDAANIALQKFDELKGTLNMEDNVENERKRIYRYVVNAIDALIELETNFNVGQSQLPPIGMEKGQWSVGLPCRFGEAQNDKVDVIGYLDYLYDNGEKQTIVDLKTTARIPSEWSPAHAMQAAFYKRAHGNNPDVYFVYASPKEEGKDRPFNILKLDDEIYQTYLNRLKDTIKRMSNTLRLSEDPFVLAESLPHDDTTFYWKGEKSLSEIVEDVKTETENSVKEN